MIKTLLFLTCLLVVQGVWGKSELHPDCPAIAHYLLPHEYDCTKFYYCEWGRKFIEPTNCGPGTEFSEQLQVCTWPYLAACNLPGHPTTTTTTSSSTTTTTTTTTETPTTTTTEEPTTTTTTTQEPTTTTTTTQEPTTTTTTTQEPTTTTTTTQEPTTTTTVEITEPTTTTSTTQEPTTTTSTTVVVTEPTTTTSTTAAPVTPPGDDECTVDPGVSEEDRKCQSECNLFPWAHEDCDKYWICQGQKAVLIVCSEGLHFNPSASSCDFACNSGCVRDSVQATAGHEGLKLYLPWNKIDDNTKKLIKLISL